MTEQRIAGTGAARDPFAAGRWTAATIAYLRSEHGCPRCLDGVLVASVCRSCGADLAGPAGGELRMASAQAAEALARRQLVIDGLPAAATTTTTATTTSTTATTTAEPHQRRASPTPAAALPASDARQVSVQSVLAVAGAGLLAIASFVFTFLNPDLTDVGARSAIVGVVALVFLGGGWLLSRRSLRFSAETIGALGLLFVAVDGWSVATTLPATPATQLVPATRDTRRVMARRTFTRAAL